MTALELAQELIRRPSPSQQSNAAVADWLSWQLHELGFETERLEYRDNSGVQKVNLVARRGDGASGGLALFAHTDTVPAGDWTDGEPFAPQLRNGRLYGRGSCDMKGPLACMLAAAAVCSQDPLTRPLYLVCTADEESGYLGARQVVDRSQMFLELKSGVGIVGEPTGLEVVYAHKAAVGFRATARGRAAHSSTGSGANANLPMIPFLAEMKAIYDELQSDPRHRNDEFDPPTPGWNIGINDGNTPINVTAARSICTVYFRPMPGTDVEGLVERVRRAAQRCGLELETWGCAQPLYTDPDSPFVRQVLAVAGRDRARTVPYGTDALAFGPHLPLVVCGPGHVAQAHTPNEWIAIEQLRRGTELYAKLIRHFCQ